MLHFWELMCIIGRHGSTDLCGTDIKDKLDKGKNHLSIRVSAFLLA